MGRYIFQIRQTIVGILLVSLGTLTYACAATVSNVALGKPATQTDSAGGADPKLAVDGDTTTCSRTDSFTAEWEFDLEEYYLIEDVSIVTESVSQWVASVISSSDSILEVLNSPAYVLNSNDNKYWKGSSIDVKFDRKVMVSRVDIYENIYRDRVGKITCNDNEGGWITLWSTTSTTQAVGSGTFSPTLTASCFSNNIRLESKSGTTVFIDAIQIHGSENKTFKIKMGLTHWTYRAEGILSKFTASTATWSPAEKGPYRYIIIQAEPQNEPFTLCELEVKGYPQPRTPQFRVFTGIAMSNPPVSTVFKVVSKIECTSICLSQTKPECLTSQFDQVTKSCALFNGFEHTKQPGNTNKTFVFEFAAHFFVN